MRGFCPLTSLFIGDRPLPAAPGQVAGGSHNSMLAFGYGGLSLARLKQAGEHSHLFSKAAMLVLASVTSFSGGSDSTAVEPKPEGSDFLGLLPGAVIRAFLTSHIVCL